jgi:hypothetical protein
VDLRFVEDNGSISQQVLDDSAIEGDVCHNGDNVDYIVEKELMNNTGQLPADQWYFAEDKLGSGAANPPAGAVPNFPTDQYVYHFYAAAVDRIIWNCSEWLSIDPITCDK